MRGPVRWPSASGGIMSRLRPHPRPFSQTGEGGARGRLAEKVRLERLREPHPNLKSAETRLDKLTWLSVIEFVASSLIMTADPTCDIALALVSAA